MGRWQPGAGDRLGEAALALYLERGFEQTTVADIAERAGVTARTFFRYFADKREVLFDGSSEVEKVLLAAAQAAPVTSSVLDVVAAVLDAIAPIVGVNRELVRARQAVIMANADLRERDLIKQAALTAALADSLRDRGSGDIEAALAAETATAVFRVALNQWAGAPQERELRDVIDETLKQLRTLLST